MKDPGLVVLAEHCKGINSIKLRYCRVADTGLAPLANHFKGIAHIDLYGCFEVTDTGLAALAECNGITCINLDNYYQVTGTGLAALALHCKGAPPAAKQPARGVSRFQKYNKTQVAYMAILR